jgi:hypothetical protein
VTSNDSYTVIQQTHTTKETTMLVKFNGSNFRDSSWHIQDVDIEEIVLAYMGQKRDLADTMAAKGGSLR